MAVGLYFLWFLWYNKGIWGCSLKTSIIEISYLGFCNFIKIGREGIEMKKGIVAVVVIVVMFIAVMRGMGDVRPPELKEALTEVKSQLTQQLMWQRDGQFWRSAPNAAYLIASSVRNDKEYRIDISLENDDGEEILVEIIRSFPETGIFWQDFYKKQLLTDLASDEKVAAAHAEHQHLRVSGVVLTYFETLLSGNMGSVEIRDLDGDGKWDSMDRG